MESTRPLADCTDLESVENVLVYVCDSLRFDATPADVLERGVSGKAVAASTYTGSGYPSILTGQYPANHGVWSLSEALSHAPQLLSVRESGVDADNVWHDVDDASKPPLRMCHLESSTSLDELDAPFVHVVHDFGGHMVYGGRAARERWSSVTAQLADLSDDEARLRELYHRGVRESIERFDRICNALQARGCYEDTLVVFTSDHGELLGEHAGLYGHGSPMVPNVLEVPLVFAGAGLDAGRVVAGVTSTVDVAPTALAALGERVPEHVDGVDLWNEGVPLDRVAHSHVWKRTRYPGVEYRAAGAFDDDGGVVRHGRNLLTRLAYTGANDLLRRPHAPVVRRRFPDRELVRACAKRRRTYGDPAPATRDAVADPDAFSADVDQPDPEVDGPTREQLRELGYLD